MKLFRAIQDANISQPSAVAIGVFDGVHLGHRALIDGMVKHARNHGLLPIVVTFDPHPVEIIKGPQVGFYLTQVDQKVALLEDMGVEIVIITEFNQAARQMRAEHFLNLLLDHLSMQSLWVGQDFAMGYKREGNVEYLAAQTSVFNYKLDVIEDYVRDDARISSSRIRKELAAGSIDIVSAMLGRPYELVGSVVDGEHRGRTIGFPTANLGYDEGSAVPARGVYAAWAVVKGQPHPAVVNIGYRPTFNDEPEIRVEAHLLDFSEDIYGQSIALQFLKRLRDEKKFDGINELIAQISADVDAARTLFADELAR